MNADPKQEEDLEDIDDSEELDLDDDEVESEAAALAVGNDDDEDEDETSLDQILAQRAASRKGTDDSDEDDDIMAFPSDVEPENMTGPLPTKVIPIQDRKEFVCKRCRLVKKRSQLADAERELCRDCY